MVRAFTISFEFDGKTYLALASMKTSDDNMIYSVRVYDDLLARIIPERTISYSDQKPLCPSSLKHHRALNLFTCISKAVALHLQACKNVTG
jgi:hypothetical protein